LIVRWLTPLSRAAVEIEAPCRISARAFKACSRADWLRFGSLLIAGFRERERFFMGLLDFIATRFRGESHTTLLANRKEAKHFGAITGFSCQTRATFGAIGSACGPVSLDFYADASLDRF
jgi:hypothetical protein